MLLLRLLQRLVVQLPRGDDLLASVWSGLACLLPLWTQLNILLSSVFEGLLLQGLFNKNIRRIVEVLIQNKPRYNFTNVSI